MCLPRTQMAVKSSHIACALGVPGAGIGGMRCINGAQAMLGRHAAWWVMLLALNSIRMHPALFALLMLQTNLLSESHELTHARSCGCTGQYTDGAGASCSRCLPRAGLTRHAVLANKMREIGR